MGAPQPDPAPPPLPESAHKAVQECQDYFRALGLAPGAPHVTPPKVLTPAQKQFEATVDRIENRADKALYTQERYAAELARAKLYADRFVDDWAGPLPAAKTPKESRDLLKAKLHAIVDGAAGMETGWNPDTVRGSRSRAHTGVFQADWDFMSAALHRFEENPLAMGALKSHADDMAALKVAANATPKHGLPATAFAGQGAAFAAMAMQSYENFVSRGGRPENFSGTTLYQDHLLGLTGGNAYRGALSAESTRKGHPGISKGAYNGNYLVASSPLARVNDLNPDRLVYSEAAPEDVRRMLHDKFVNARNALADKGASDERLAAFENAFLPEWKDTSVKENDIARVRELHALGDFARLQPEAHTDACEVLKPLPALKSPKPAGPVK